jgi:hypothetical protein
LVDEKHERKEKERKERKKKEFGWTDLSIEFFSDAVSPFEMKRKGFGGV